MIVGIVGSRRRDSVKDLMTLMEELQRLHKQDKITKIITGDCKKGGDRFAREIAEAERGEVELVVKEAILPETGSPYYDFVMVYYKRNEEIAKETMDYLLALVASDRKGGTENTIKHFKRYHKDWKEKLILL